MTKHIVGQAKDYESDTIPGDFATLVDPLPEVRRRGARELQEIPMHNRLRLRLLEDPRRPPARAARGRRAAARSARSARSRDSAASMGRPFSARLKLTDEQRGQFDFGDGERRRRRRSARLHRPRAAGRLPEVRRPRVRAAAWHMSARRPSEPRQDLRFPFRPHDPAAADRARADAEAARDEEDRPAAVRLGAHAPAFLGVPRRASRTARSASNSRPRTRPKRARGKGGRIHGSRVLGHASRGQAPVELHVGKLRPVREARRSQRHASRQRQCRALRWTRRWSCSPPRRGKAGRKRRRRRSTSRGKTANAARGEPPANRPPKPLR